MNKVVVFDTSQDGGIPQTGCEEAYCDRALNDLLFHRYPSSVAAVYEKSKVTH